MNRETKFAEWIAFNGYSLNNFQNGVGYWSNLKSLKTTSELLEYFNKENPVRSKHKKGGYKITTDDLRNIWTMYQRGMNHTEIAREFVSERGNKVTRRHISAILRKKRWGRESEIITKSIGIK